jgi:hypothetical protein
VLAQGLGAARAAVKGPVSLSLRVASATVEVTASATSEVKLTLPGAPAVRIALLSGGGDRLEPEFDGRRRLRTGKLLVEVPRGSRLDLSSLEGRITVRGVGGEVRARASSGDLDLIGASKVDAEAIDGEVDVLEVTGPVSVRTVSGRVTISSAAPSPGLEVETASGDIEWRGRCAEGCHLDADTVSGRIRFLVDPASSFTFGATSHGGKVRDLAGLTPSGARPTDGSPEAAWLRGRLGAGEGEIECESFSGEISLERTK